MSSSNQPRTRSDLTAGVQLPPGQFRRFLIYLWRGDVLARIGLCFVAAAIIWGVTQGWAPPFRFHSGYTPPRDIVARVDFTTGEEDGPENERRRQRARAQTVCIYQHDVQPLVEMRGALKNRVFQIMQNEMLESLSEQDREAWQEFLPAPEKTDDEEQLFKELHVELADDSDLAKFERGVQIAFTDYERDGLLAQLEHGFEEGSQTAIMVHPVGNLEFLHRVDVSQVRIGEATADLGERLREGFKAAGLPDDYLETLSQLTLNWINKTHLPATLRLDVEPTNEARNQAAEQVELAYVNYVAGDLLAKAGVPLSENDIVSLKAEHKSLAALDSWGARVRYTLAFFGMFVAMYTLCGTYLYFYRPRLLSNLRQFATLLGLVVVTVVCCAVVAPDPWRADIVPLTLFGIILTIAYQREMALLLSAAVSLVVTLSVGDSLAEFVILVAAVSAAILLVGRVRSRTRLIYVGLGSAAVVAGTTMGVGTLLGQPFGWSGTGTLGELAGWAAESFILQLGLGALWNGFCAALAGMLMTGLLPFVELVFDVQTDISLLELGDAAHPLLQELVRRAPGTYNHSINVASIAEAAAEAIGANGLLCRVGAYFHDIGKMLKPGYFVENQTGGGNRHDSLMPAMSTLVIIAHVKDGADLARQHRLPRKIIDFIEQHHGTTLVEYFYRQATKQSEEDPNSAEVDETSFRYPGPKPQTREAGVLMLADASESACRTLSDPAPARIEHLVHEITMSRLLDRQFDECRLTLRDLGIIQESLVKSLTAVYHGRVKYPSQQTA